MAVLVHVQRCGNVCQISTMELAVLNSGPQINNYFRWTKQENLPWMDDGCAFSNSVAAPSWLHKLAGKSWFLLPTLDLIDSLESLGPQWPPSSDQKPQIPENLEARTVERISSKRMTEDTKCPTCQCTVTLSGR